MERGFMYLFAIIDWHSRRIVGWEISSTLDTGFCISALKRAISENGVCPEIINTDQGCQFTSEEWFNVASEHGIKLSMDGKGRWVDNVLIERFWRTIKYEDIYLHSYENGHELQKGVAAFICRYNSDRPHVEHDIFTPDEVYKGTCDEVKRRITDAA